MAAILVSTGGFSVRGADPSPTTATVIPSGIGAGIYFVAGTADYEFELTADGNYYLIGFADRGSSLEGSLSHNGTVVASETYRFGGLTLVKLEPARYDLHLEGSGKVAIGWDFVSPGIQQFPADQRLVAALVTGAENRLTLSMPTSSVPSVHIFAYNEEMDLGLDAVFSPGDSKTFDFPWATSNWVTLVAEPLPGPGTFSLGWTSTEAPAIQNSFLLPIGVIALVVALTSVPTALFVIRRLRRHA